MVFIPLICLQLCPLVSTIWNRTSKNTLVPIIRTPCLIKPRKVMNNSMNHSINHTISHSARFAVFRNYLSLKQQVNHHLSFTHGSRPCIGYYYCSLLFGTNLVTNIIIFCDIWHASILYTPIENPPDLLLSSGLTPWLKADLNVLAKANILKLS